MYSISVIFNNDTSMIIDVNAHSVSENNLYAVRLTGDGSVGKQWVFPLASLAYFAVQYVDDPSFD